MRYITILLLFISTCLFSQETTKTSFIGVVDFSEFIVAGSYDVSGNLINFSDQTNQYFANSIQVGDVIWDNLGNRWEVETIGVATLLTVVVELTDVNGVGGTPFGRGFVSRETNTLGLSLLPPDNVIGLSSQAKSRVESHNMIVIDNYLSNIGNNKVYKIDVGADTASILSPVEGDVAYVNSAQVYFRDTYVWRLFAGGGGGTTEIADGETIKGLGTPGDEFRADTTLLATTKALNDSIALSNGIYSGSDTIAESVTATVQDGQYFNITGADPVSYSSIRIGEPSPLMRAYYDLGGLDEAYLGFGGTINDSVKDARMELYGTNGYTGIFMTDETLIGHYLDAIVQNSLGHDYGFRIDESTDMDFWHPGGFNFYLGRKGNPGTAVLSVQPDYVRVNKNLDLFTSKLVGEGGSDGIYVDFDGNVAIKTTPSEFYDFEVNGSTFLFGNLRLGSALLDFTSQPGTAGQLLSSNGFGVAWTNNPVSGTQYAIPYFATSTTLGDSPLTWDGTTHTMSITDGTFFNYVEHTADQVNWAVLNPGAGDQTTLNITPLGMSLTGEESITLMADSIRFSAPTGINQFKAGNYDWNVSQNTTGLDGYVQAFNSSTGKIELTDANALVAGDTLGNGIATTDVQLINGSAAVPSLNFAGAPTSGLYYIGAFNWGAVVNGVDAMTFTAGDVRSILPHRFDAQIRALSGGGPTAPAISFNGDTNLGLWRSAADQMDVVTASNRVARFLPNGNVTFDNNVGIGNGATDPSFSLDVNGTTRSSAFRSVGSGSPSAPVFYHDGDSNTGTFRPGTDQWAVTTGGILAATFDENQDLTLTKSFNIPETSDAFTGLIRVGGNVFLHTYDPPNNGTVDPTGNNIFIGYQAGNQTMGSTATSLAHSSNNIGIGRRALFSLTTGWRNVVIGEGAGDNLTTGYNNNLWGYQAGLFLTTGNTNTIIGSLSGQYAADGITPLTTTANTILIGAGAKAALDGGSNEIVIGPSNTTGLGSNTVQIGNTSVTDFGMGDHRFDISADLTGKDGQVWAYNEGAGEFQVTNIFGNSIDISSNYIKQSNTYILNRYMTANGTGYYRFNTGVVVNDSSFTNVTITYLFTQQSAAGSERNNGTMIFHGRMSNTGQWNRCVLTVDGELQLTNNVQFGRDDLTGELVIYVGAAADGKNVFFTLKSVQFPALGTATNYFDPDLINLVRTTVTTGYTIDQTSGFTTIAAIPGVAISSLVDGGGQASMLTLANNKGAADATEVSLQLIPAGGITQGLGSGLNETRGAFVKSRYNLARNDFDLILGAADNANAGTDRVTILGNGNVGFGTSSPSFLIDAQGTGRFTSNLTAFKLFTTGGSTTLPAISSNADQNTGIDWSDDDNLQFVTGGVKAMNVDENQVVSIGESDFVSSSQDVKLFISGTGTGPNGRTTIEIDNSSNSSGASLLLRNGNNNTATIQYTGSTYVVGEQLSIGTTADIKVVHSTNGGTASGGDSKIVYRPGGYSETAIMNAHRTGVAIGQGETTASFPLDVAADTIRLGNHKFDLSTVPTNGQIWVWNNTTEHWEPGSSGAADNLGNHTATQNIDLGSEFLSPDGTDLGIRLDAQGDMYLNSNTYMDANDAFYAEIDSSYLSLNFFDKDGAITPTPMVSLIDGNGYAIVLSAGNDNTSLVYDNAAIFRIKAQTRANIENNPLATSGSIDVVRLDGTANANSIRATSTGVGILNATPAFPLDVTGVARATVLRTNGSGIASSTSIYVDGDSNTGWFRPSEDNMAFSTGGTERLRITNDGRVWFNGGNAALPVLTKNNDTNTGIFFPVDDNIGISTGGVERLRIDPSGNVGIGTSAPATKLTISDVTDPVIQFNRTTGGMSNTYTGVGFSPNVTSATTAQIDNWSTGGLVFNGFSGLASEPGVALSGYTKASPTAPAIVLTGWKPNGANRTALTGTEKVFMLQTGLDVTWNTAIMTALGDGSVGIGTTNPSYTLDVTGAGRFTSAVRGDRFLATNGGSSALTAIADANDTNTGIYFPAADNITIATGGVDILTANELQLVGIGTTEPTHKLHVSSDTEVALIEQSITGTSAVSASLELRKSSSSAAINGFGPGLYFSMDDSDGSGTLGIIAAARDGADNTGELRLYSYNAGVSQLALTLQPDGDLELDDYGHNENSGANLSSSWGVLMADANGVAKRFEVSNCFARMAGGSTTFTSGVPESIAGDVAPTTSSKISGTEDWTVTNDSLQYTETENRLFSVTVFVDGDGSAPGDYTFSLAKNGTIVTASSMTETVSSANDKVDTPLMYVISVSTNDVLQVFVDVDSGSPTFSVENVLIKIEPFDN